MKCNNLKVKPVTQTHYVMMTICRVFYFLRIGCGNWLIRWLLVLDLSICVLLPRFIGTWTTLIED